jgi:hypothetical protein
LSWSSLAMPTILRKSLMCVLWSPWSCMTSPYSGCSTTVPLHANSYNRDWFRFTMFNSTFNNISVILWWSVLLMEDTRVPRENHCSVKSHWQNLSHNVVSNTPRHEQIQNFSGCTCSCINYYYTITTMAIPPTIDFSL